MTDKSLTADVGVRSVYFFKSQGSKLTEITTAAQTAGELHDTLAELQIDIKGLSLIDGEQEEKYYNLRDTQLPTGDFTVFAMPEKQKLGARVNYPQNKGYFAIIREIKSGKYNVSEFGNLHASNVDSLRKKLAKKYSKTPVRAGKLRVAKITKDDVLAKCRKKLIKLGVKESSRLINQIDAVTPRRMRSLADFKRRAAELSKA